MERILSKNTKVPQWAQWARTGGGTTSQEFEQWVYEYDREEVETFRRWARRPRAEAMEIGPGSDEAWKEVQGMKEAWRAFCQRMDDAEQRTRLRQAKQQRSQQQRQAIVQWTHDAMQDVIGL